MRLKTVLTGFIGLIFILFSGCRKESGPLDALTYQKGAKLLRILLYSSIENKNPLYITEEYEYDKSNRVSKISSPMYQDGKVSGILKYDLYEYNPKGQLAKIANFNSNISSPTGFINLKNTTYTYSEDGRKEKAITEYPQINSSEYSLFTYNSNQLVKIENYDKSNKLIAYITNNYDNSGNLIKETSFSNDDRPISYTSHTYKNGLNVRSDVFSGLDMKVHIREIIRTFDKNKNLIILKSNELSIFSSTMSYVLKYEYAD